MGIKRVVLITAALLTAAALIVFLVRSNRIIDRRAVVSKSVAPVLKKYSLSESNSTKKYAARKRHGMSKYFFSFEAYDVPEDFRFDRFAGDLKRAAVKNGFKLTRSEKIILKAKEIGIFTLSSGKLNLLTISLAKRRGAALPAVKKRVPKPRMAVVMDDLGYNTKYLKDIFAIKEPITFAILPRAPFSATTARLCASKGYEVILHLPLESREDNEYEEEETIKSGMNAKKVLGILDADLHDVPGARGVSNHTGSKGTEDKRVMSVIMGELKNRGLYFFDSLTSKKSVCAEAASEAGVKYGRRDAFLDLPCDIDYIEKQILMARKMAFKKGSAVVICHYRKNTVRALVKWMPILKNDGIRFVTLSEMVK